ncbi:ABC transporter ATP-binding protein [Sphaerotilus uruguayifluvii]|uniref:Iron(III) transport system ATP-binding protein n=1 Tax=Sphaerotilus uruguayifluvii TaxID=2735897 RepID=A0ABX2FZM2_9BURK|nr:ABC transporter ATP-binding protein [Leptothrix sp. C29]NRT55470.1 iron(III) transport system ATP-binding protein [Leptothrix sp. C29]
MFLHVDQLSVRYPGAPRASVSEVSLGLERGGIGALLGPSGCGKTSLLRAIAGLERPAAGRVVLEDEPVADAARGLHLPPERRRIGMVFQDYALFPHMTVAENVAFGIAHLPRAERERRGAELLALVGLAETAHRLPHQLSGGQQQRIALARALAPRPRLLLMDEPFSSLDVDLRERLAQEVRAILRQTGTTALFVTHDQMEAFAVADAVGVMQAGELQQWAPPAELYRRPATRFVATFVGQGTLAPASAVLPRQAGMAGRDVLLRADEVVHDAASPLRARLRAKAFRGAEFLYTLELAGGEQLLAQVPAHHDHAIGEWIGIRAAVDRPVTFPRDLKGAAAA